MLDKNRIQEFTDLNSWKESHDLVLSIYKLSGKIPENEKFGIISQIKRASVSITSNIAEGFGRQTYKEKIQFYYLAHGSLTEVKNQVILIKDLGYITESDFNDIIYKIANSQRLILGLIKKSKTFLKK